MHPLIADFINGIDPSPPSGWMEDFHLQAVVHARHTNESAPESGSLPKFNRSEPQAATMVGLTSRSLLELAIAPDFIPSGISRTRLTVGAVLQLAPRPPGIYAERPRDELPECSGSIHHLRD